MIRSILAPETSKKSEQSDKSGIILGIIGWSFISFIFWPIVAIILLFMWVSNDEPLQGGRRYIAYVVLLCTVSVAYALIVDK